MGFGAKGGLVVVAGEGNLGYQGVTQNAPATTEVLYGSAMPDSATIPTTGVLYGSAMPDSATIPTTAEVAAT